MLRVSLVVRVLGKVVAVGMIWNALGLGLCIWGSRNVAWEEETHGQGGPMDRPTCQVAHLCCVVQVLEHVRVSGGLGAGSLRVVSAGMLEPWLGECACVAAALSKSRKRVERIDVWLTKVGFFHGSAA